MNVTHSQTPIIREPLAEVNHRWDDLNRSISNRQKELEQALLRQGQFLHAMNDFSSWLDTTNHTIDILKPKAGDPHVIEVELAKLKVTGLRKKVSLFPFSK